MKRSIVLVTAFVLTLGILAFAGTHVISAMERPTSTTTSSMQVGDQTRSWVTILPAAQLPPSAPIVMFLSGKAASTSQEINRDEFLQYVDADKMELVYPNAIHESWNVGDQCCGWAGLHNTDDIDFIKALIPKIDPGHVRPLYVVGYSNGGKLAYALACQDPGLFDAIAVAKADPEPGCNVTTPQSIIDIAATDDTFVPYLPGEKGLESPAATVQIARLEQSERCGPGTSGMEKGDLTETTWTCGNGTRLTFAVYSAGGHNFPWPTAKQPAAAAVIYSFFMKTPLQPLPETPAQDQPRLAAVRPAAPGRGP